MDFEMDKYFTIIIASMVAVIGFLQYINNRDRKEIERETLRLDLFDRRGVLPIN